MTFVIHRVTLYSVTVLQVKIFKRFPNLETEFGDKNCGCQVGKSANTAVTANRRASWLGKTSM